MTRMQRSGGQAGGGSGEGGSRAGGGGNGATGGAGGMLRDAPAERGDGPVTPEVTPDAPADLLPDRPGDLPVEVAPPRSQPDGAGCLTGAECLSGVCAQGICCNKTCDDPCYSCARASNQMADGRCEISRVMVGQKCGRGCQQVVATSPAVVDKICDAQGRCLVPEIPQNFELCADNDPCTTVNCDQDTLAHTARCVTIGCAAGMCCCLTTNGSGSDRACRPTNGCMGANRSCQP